MLHKRRWGLDASSGSGGLLSGRSQTISFQMGDVQRDRTEISGLLGTNKRFITDPPEDPEQLPNRDLADLLLPSLLL